MLEVAHALRQCLHFAQTFVHLLKPVSDLLEALAQTRFKRGLQLFVDRGAHLVELFLVALLQGSQPLLDHLANLAQAAFVAFGELVQLLVQAVGETL